MLLYVASRARLEPEFSPFVYLQNLAVLIATISKMGIDTLVVTDANKEFRLGAKGSALMFAGLVICTCSFVGLADSATCVASFCLSALTVQNALKTALATREAHYMRAALESAWVLPALLAYVLVRKGGADAWEISIVAAILLAVRVDRELITFLFGEAKGGFQWKKLTYVWVFQVLNIGIFRLDQTVVATTGVRGSGTDATADLFFWSKANDLSNAVATALGGVTNREELTGRSRKTTKLIRLVFPFACLAIYAVAWVVLSRQVDQSFIAMGIFSLLSASLAFEINRRSFALMWHKNYLTLIRIWATCLLAGVVLVAISLMSRQIWLLPLAVTVQLFLIIASLKNISKPAL